MLVKYTIVQFGLKTENLYYVVTLVGFTRQKRGQELNNFCNTLFNHSVLDTF